MAAKRDHADEGEREHAGNEEKEMAGLHASNAAANTGPSELRTMSQAVSAGAAKAIAWISKPSMTSVKKVNASTTSCSGPNRASSSTVLTSTGLFARGGMPPCWTSTC